jgi:hypothetical protein
MNNKSFLPRSVAERILLGLLSFFFAALSGLFLHSWFILNPNNITNPLLRAAVLEFALAIFLLSTLTLVWCLATPRFLETLLLKQAKHVSILVFCLSLGLLTMCLYAFQYVF